MKTKIFLYSLVVLMALFMILELKIPLVITYIVFMVVALKRKRVELE